MPSSFQPDAYIFSVFFMTLRKTNEASFLFIKFIH